MLGSLVKLALTPVVVTAAVATDVVKTVTGDLEIGETPLDTTAESIAYAVDTLVEVANGGTNERTT